MKNTILTALMFCCLAFSLVAQTEKPKQSQEIEEAPVMIDQEIEEAPPVMRSQEIVEEDIPPPPPPSDLSPTPRPMPKPKPAPRVEVEEALPPPPPPPAPRRATSDEEEVFIVVEQMPRFPGCEEESDRNKRNVCSKEAMLKYVIEHPKYKEESGKGLKGTAVIRFVVRKDGKIDDVALVRAITDNPESVQNMKEIVSSMPNWIPGKQRGQAVDVRFNLPIKFK